MYATAAATNGLHYNGARLNSLIANSTGATPKGDVFVWSEEGIYLYCGVSTTDGLDFRADNCSGFKFCGGQCKSALEHLKAIRDMMAMKHIRLTPFSYGAVVGLIKNFVPGPSKQAFKPAPPCKRCNMLNEFAVSNQPDGSYVCYVCR